MVKRSDCVQEVVFLYRQQLMLLLGFLGSAALWAQDPEPEVEASDDDAQVEAEASPPADEVTDEEIEELLGLDEDYSEIEEEEFNPTEGVRFEQSIPYPTDI
jgi:hypothetical protein